MNGSVGPDKKPIISVFLPDLRPGGAEAVHVALARAWLDFGADVEFVLMQKQGELLADIPSSVGLKNLKVRRIRGSIFPLVDYLRDRRPDVFVAAMWPLTFVGALAIKLSRVKSIFVVSEHTLLSEAYRSHSAVHKLVLRITTAIAYRWAANVVAVSKAVAENLADVSGLPSSRFSVIYNPAARGVASVPVSVRKDRDRRVTVITVGTLKKSKNHALLLRAFKLLPDSLGAQLIILGEGSMRKDTEQLVADLNLTAKVHLPGYSSDPYQYLHQSDLFVLSADYEGFGNVLVEALECGLPVVSTDCKGGPREILDNGRYGELVPTGDPSALARAMAKAINNPPLPSIQNERAQFFTVEKSARSYYDLFGLVPTAVNDARNVVVEVD